MSNSILDKFIVFYNESSPIIKIDVGDYVHARLKFDFFIDQCDDLGISYTPFTVNDIDVVFPP